MGVLARVTACTDSAVDSTFVAHIISNARPVGTRGPIRRQCRQSRAGLHHGLPQPGRATKGARLRPASPTPATLTIRANSASSFATCWRHSHRSSSRFATSASSLIVTPTSSRGPLGTVDLIERRGSRRRAGEPMIALRFRSSIIDARASRIGKHAS